MSEKVTHPTTGKTITVDVFPIVPKALLSWSATAKPQSAKAISWHILSEAKSVARMARQMDGEGQHDNYALRTFENALDWSLGLAWLHILTAYRGTGKLPKPFDLLATRTGAILMRYASGRIVEVLA
jgi:hypothetical protein